MAQGEQRVELVDELGGSVAPAHRPDVHGEACGRLGGHLEDRERDVEARAHVDVAVGALQLHVARRPPLLDQPVLEHERARARSSSACSRPPRPCSVQPAGAQKCARARVRSDTDLPTYSGRPRTSRKMYTPGSSGSFARSGRSSRGDLAPLRLVGLGAAPAAARRQHGRSPRRAWRPWRTASGTARRRRARTSRRRRARGARPSTSMPSASASGASLRCRASGANRRAIATVQRIGGVGPLDARALEGLRAARAGRTRRCARPARGPGHLLQLRQHLAAGGASSRPSPA